MNTESTGIPELDYITGGLPSNALTVLLGSPGTGKTVMALQMAMHHARQGNDVIFFSAFSEPHEKLLAHVSSFSFFEPELVGDRITMLSLKSALAESVDKTLEIILRTARGKREPLIIIDGFRGVYQHVGALTSGELLSGLSSQLPYQHARSLVTTEVLTGEPEDFFELSAADVLISLHNAGRGAQPRRTLEVFKIRGHGYREGEHGMAIDQSGIVVYPRLAACLPETVPAPTPHRCSFDLPAFDAMLGGGLPDYSTTVFAGDFGTGKTTFCLHYLLAGSRVGDVGLMVTLGDTAVDLLQKAADLDLASPVEAGQIHFLEAPPVEINPYQLGWQIHEMVTTLGVKRLVIDSLTNLEAAPGIQQSQRDYLGALMVYLRRSGVTTVMTQDSTRYEATGAVRMPTANNRVLLRRVAYAGRYYRICSIVNMQRSDHDTAAHEFTIGRGGIRILDAAETTPGVLAGIETGHPVAAF